MLLSVNGHLHWKAVVVTSNDLMMEVWICRKMLFQLGLCIKFLCACPMFKLVEQY